MHLPSRSFFRQPSSWTNSNKSFFDASPCCSCCCTFLFLGTCLVGVFWTCRFTIDFLTGLILNSVLDSPRLLAVEANSSSELPTIISLLLCLEVISFKYLRWHELHLLVWRVENFASSNGRLHLIHSWYERDRHLSHERLPVTRGVSRMHQLQIGMCKDEQLLPQYIELRRMSH